MLPWELGPITSVPLEAFTENLGYLRLPRPDFEKRLGRSLERDGQLTPLVAAPLGRSYEVIDGFKRLRAARQSAKLPKLSVRPLTAEAAQLKAAILLLNQHGAGVSALEEGWVIRALVRQEGKTQLQVAELFSRHQSWVSRRLSLAERLAEEIQQDVRLGLLTPATAQTLARMPRGIQQELWTAIRSEGLTSRETEALANLCLESRPERRRLLLWHPRETLEEELAKTPRPLRDPRLGELAAQMMLKLQQLEAIARRLCSALEECDHSSFRPQEQTLLSTQALAVSRSLEALSPALKRLAVPSAPVEASMAHSCDTPHEPTSKTS